MCIRDRATPGHDGSDTTPFTPMPDLEESPNRSMPAPLACPSAPGPLPAHAGPLHLPLQREAWPSAP
eukprot:4629026-Alexandrium_andersonii.AAC.1